MLNAKARVFVLLLVMPKKEITVVCEGTEFFAVGNLKAILVNIRKMPRFVWYYTQVI